MTAEERSAEVVRELLDEIEACRPSMYPPWRPHEVERFSGRIVVAIREAERLAVAAEREACARLVSPKSRLIGPLAMEIQTNLAAAIRGRA